MVTTTAQERLHTFRARSHEYLQHGHDRLAAARFVVEAAGPLRGPALDLGTGKGLLAIELARRGLDVVTIDVDDEHRELAQLLADEAGVADRITFDLGDGARLPYAGGRFGCVAMFDVPHHLDDPEPVLRELVRVLAAGGTAVVADFDEPGFELVARIHRGEGREHPRTAATVASTTAQLVAAGLTLAGRTNGHQHDVAVLRKGSP